MKKEVCFLVALLTSLAVLQGRADDLYFAPAADEPSATMAIKNVLCIIYLSFSSST